MQRTSTCEEDATRTRLKIYILFVDNNNSPDTWWLSLLEDSGKISGPVIQIAHLLTNVLRITSECRIQKQTINVNSKGM